VRPCLDCVLRPSSGRKNALLRPHLKGSAWQARGELLKDSLVEPDGSGAYWATNVLDGTIAPGPPRVREFADAAYCPWANLFPLLPRRSQIGIPGAIGKSTALTND
jgi:hypothetical protein